MPRGAVGPERMRGITLLLAAAATFVAGCQTAPVRLFNLVILQPQPLTLALVLEDRPASAAEAFNPFPPYAAFQRALAKEIGRTIAMDVCFGFQARLGLDSGWYQLVLVTPAQYARLTRGGEVNVLAVPLDRQGRERRSAVLVVASSSPLNQVEDLRGRVVAFGPEDDGRTHHAALLLLREHGLQPEDLVLGALPLPGTLKHMPHMRAVAQTVINGSSDAGFIDEAAWEQLPPHADADGEPAQDKLRIVARTAALPTRLMVASPCLDAATADKVRAALLHLGEGHADALAPLDISGYRQPDAETLAACRALDVPGDMALPETPTESEPAPD